MDAFYEAMSDVKRIDSSDKVYSNNATQSSLAQSLRREAINREIEHSKNYLTLADIEPVHPDDPIWFKQDGVQDLVFKNLRLGKYTPDAVLNIQHMTLEKAHSNFFDFIVKAYKRGARSILIKHGKHRGSSPFPGFLKSYTNVWLQQIPEVLAFHSCLPQHGGTSATYALLKKNRELKEENREKHKAR